MPNLVRSGCPSRDKPFGMKYRLVSGVLLFPLIQACGDEPVNDVLGGTGAAAASGGFTSSGGSSTSTGGTDMNSGGTATGGADTNAGGTATGGAAIGAGGSDGGAPPSGGAGTGGEAASAGGVGPSSGGSSNAGGGLGSGGSVSSGGSAPVGECGEGASDAEVRQDGSAWVAESGGAQVYSGGDMLGAIRAALDSLTPGRTTKERVVVRDSGEISAAQSIDLPSYTVFESCGTLDITGSPAGNNAAIRGQGVTDIDVPFLTVTGGPYFGIFFRESHNIHLGQIDLRLTGGLGIRIDNNPEQNGWGRTNRSENIRIDFVHVEGTNNHGVETYGVDGLTIGTVEARNTAYAGLLLNATIHAEVGLVDAVGAGTGTGYAAFRMANENGRLTNTGQWSNVDFDTDYAPNIHVGEVRAEAGGRGIFCVSGSGGATIDKVVLSGVGTNPAIFIEDCYNVHIGAEGGSVDRAGAGNSHDIAITGRGSSSSETTFLHYSAGIVIENLAITDSPISEGNCNESGNPDQLASERLPGDGPREQLSE